MLISDFIKNTTIKDKIKVSRSTFKFMLNPQENCYYGVAYDEDTYIDNDPLKMAQPIRLFTSNFYLTLASSASTLTDQTNIAKNYLHPMWGPEYITKAIQDIPPYFNSIEMYKEVLNKRGNLAVYYMATNESKHLKIFMAKPDKWEIVNELYYSSMLIKQFARLLNDNNREKRRIVTTIKSEQLDESEHMIVIYQLGSQDLPIQYVEIENYSTPQLYTCKKQQWLDFSRLWNAKKDDIHVKAKGLHYIWNTCNHGRLTEQDLEDMNVLLNRDIIAELPNNLIDSSIINRDLYQEDIRDTLWEG